MNKMKKITNIVTNVLLCLFLAIAILSVLLTIFSQKDTDGAAEIFGYQIRIVTSDSMAKSEFTDVSGYQIKDIPLRSMLFIKTVPKDAEQAEQWYRSLRVGDVLTFRYVYTAQITITHRITSIVEKETGGFLIELAGDNKSSETGQLVQTIDTSIPQSTNYVIGKVVGRAYLFGVIISFLMQPVGMILVIILPCVVIIGLEVAKIIKTMTAEKKQQEQAEKEEKEKELEELRSRLATLEKEKSEMQAAAGKTEGKEE